MMVVNFFMFVWVVLALVVVGFFCSALVRFFQRKPDEGLMKLITAALLSAVFFAIPYVYDNIAAQGGERNILGSLVEFQGTGGDIALWQKGILISFGIAVILFAAKIAISIIARRWADDDE